MRDQRRPGGRSGGRSRTSGAGRAPSARSRPGRATSRVPRREPVPAPPPDEPKPSPEAAPARRPSLTGRAAVLALVLAALIVSYASSLKAWTEQRAEIAALEEELAERQANVVAYEREIERWKDPSYVEARARERFGWVKPGEIGYIVVDETAAESTEAAESGDDRAAKASPPWWGTLWSSVERAGNPPKPKAKPTEPTPEPADTIGPGDDTDE